MDAGPGPGRGSSTHWQRSAAARPQSRCAWTRAHGLSMSTFRSAGRSVSGRRAASSARSMPYLAISSAALAVSACASAGGDAVGFRLGQQLAHPVEQARRRPPSGSAGAGQASGLPSAPG